VPTIGHELTHGFDDEGRQFDAQGNLRNWWRKADGKEFEKRARCISDQYSKYVIIDDIKINGKLTLGEDVADLGGLIQARRAWKEGAKGGKLAPIDGPTPDQRFFVGYGQSWRGSLRDEEKRPRATVDPHSSDRYRANGVVRNMPEFQEAFHCQTGARMAPEERCRVVVKRSLAVGGRGMGAFGEAWPTFRRSDPRGTLCRRCSGCSSS